MSSPARYMMIGGFLGAGKSTSILEFARYLKARQVRTGLITNDQGARLVDTLKLRANGFDVAEIPGGCFCCRFHSLTEAADHLSRETAPDVFIAEPVGSCTDLIASVSYPLRRMYGHNFTISPLSVVLDPRRAMRMLELRPGKKFSAKVAYIYLKQMEEAGFLVINKADLLSAAERELLRNALSSRYPNARIFICSARTGEGLEPWFEAILNTEQPLGDTMGLDYRIYAEGEAQLGWLNASLALSAPDYLEGDRIMNHLAQSLQTGLAAQDIEIAHLKMTLSPSDGSGELAVLNLVGSDLQPEFSQSLSDPLATGELVVNLRAEASPKQLEQALRQATESPHPEALQWRLEHFECFSPAEPQPVYRMAAAEAPLQH